MLGWPTFWLGLRLVFRSTLGKLIGGGLMALLVRRVKDRLQ